MQDLMQEMGALMLVSRIKRLADTLVQEGTRVYQASGVSFEPRWFPVFIFLYRRGPTSITGIARGLGVSHPAVNKVANELIGARLVAPYRDRNDKRKRVLALTAIGREKAQSLEPVWAQINEALQGLIQDVSPDLLQVLSNLEQGLDDKGFLARFQALQEDSPGSAAPRPV